MAFEKGFDMPELHVLTQRQSEVLGLVSKGFTNSEIGGLIGLSAGTVKVHISAIIDRLDVTNRTEAAAIWLRETIENHLDETNVQQDGQPVFAFDLSSDEEDDLGGLLIAAASDVIARRTFRIIDLATTHSARTADLDKLTLRQKLGISHLSDVALTKDDGTIFCRLTCNDLRSQTTIFSSTYEGDEQSLQRIGTEIGIDLVAAVDKNTAPPSPRPTMASKASELIWRGSYLFDKRTPEGLQQAIALFTDATKADPSSVDAFVGLANSSNQMAVYTPGIAPFLHQAGMTAARKAVELDPLSGAAQGALGYAQLFGQWDFEQAERSLDRAVRIDPKREDGYVWYSLLHLFKGDAEKSLEVAQLGMSMNPIAIANFVHLGHVYRDTGRLEQAIAHLSTALDIEPGNLRATIWLALCEADLGHFDRAASFIGRALQQFPQSSIMVGISGYVAGLAGRKEDAGAHLQTLEAMRKAPVSSPLFEAMIYIALGDFDAAIDKAEEGLAQRVPLYLGWCCDPMFLRLNAHPRYLEIADKIGVPSHHLTTPM